jgi:outer membrane protein assembly factor BamB
MGADAFDGTHLYVPCASGIREVIINAAHRSMSLGWVGPATVNAGPPMVTAGSVWFVDWGAGKLYALNPRNGSMRRGFPISIGRTPHFAAPATALGLLLIGTNTGVLAFGGPHAA